jgi:hypothetical protein
MGFGLVVWTFSALANGARSKNRTGPKIPEGKRLRLPEVVSVSASFQQEALTFRLLYSAFLS